MGIQAIILLGAPGAGKGTIAETIRQTTDYIHVSTGNMLREAIKQGAPLGRQAEQYMAKGNLVPDKLIIEIVMQRIDGGEKDAKYMFDGFPRTLAQARGLDAEFKTRKAVLTKVFLLDVPKDVTLQRLTGRRICRNCGANFHIHNIPPKKNGICDNCGGRLEQRPDDMETTILNRLEVFHQQTAALIAYYTNRGILVRVDSSRPREQTVSDVMNLLNLKCCEAPRPDSASGRGVFARPGEAWAEPCEARSPRPEPALTRSESGRGELRNELGTKAEASE